MDMLDLIKATDFLGPEFLTWLWHRSEANSGIFELEEHGPVEVYIDDQLTLSDGELGGDQHAMSGPNPSRSEEAKLALRHGKLPIKAKLRVLKDQKEWVFTLNSEKLRVHGAKLPALLTQEEDDQFTERVALIEELDAIMLALYHRFIALRIDSTTWQSETGAMKSWLTPPMR